MSHEAEQIIEGLEFIQQITIPQFITKVKLSESRRKQYYISDHQLSKTKQQKVTDGRWSYKKGKNGTYFLVDENGDWVIRNPQSYGTPKWFHLAGNKFTSGLHQGIRNKVVKEMKNFYRPYIREQAICIRDFPVRVFWYLHTTLDDTRRWDTSNLWFYYKYFEDVLIENEDEEGNRIEPIIPDDSREYVTQPGNAPILCPVDNWKDRKFEFMFFKDNREIIQNHRLYE